MVLKIDLSFYSLFVVVRASCPGHVIEVIRQVYLKCEGVILPIPWCDEFNFQIQDIFTRLRIVEKEKTRGVATTKELTNMTSIFTSHDCYEQPLIVLIEGEPGMGKTTYCQKLVFDWANKPCPEWDESFPRIDVLLLLRCRGIKSTIWDTIEDQILPNEIKPEEKEMFFQFLKENPSKVLLVLDGLDEVDPEKLEMFMNLIERKLLPGCYIVLTSRHEVGSKVRRYADTLLEIVGFTTTDAECYVRKYFQHAEHLAEALISKVKFDRDLRELTQNPLNTLLLCVICEDLEGVLPTNRTQLYVEIVLLILRCYESKNGLSNRGKDLLLVYKKELMILGETALHSLRKQELYFDDYKGDIKESLLMKFGFLSIQSGGSKRAPCDRYGFFHKSFQEFFSGFFLAFSLIDRYMSGLFHALKFRNVMDDFTSSRSILTDERYMGELFHVFKFTIGIVALRSEKTAVSIVKMIASIVNETCGRSEKFASNLIVAYELINVCKTCSDDLYTKLVRTFGESLQLVHVVAKSSIFSNIEFIEMFCQALRANTYISYLNFRSTSMGDEGAISLAQVLRVNTFLSSLDLSDNCIGDKGANSLAQALSVNTSLSSLDLSHNLIGCEGANSLARALMVNNSLSSLYFSDNLNGSEGANSLAQEPRVNTSLSLNFLRNSISSEGANSLAQSLGVNTSLPLNLLRNSISSEEANSLAQALGVNTSLSSLVLFMNSIGDGGTNSINSEEENSVFQVVSIYMRLLECLVDH